MIEIKDDGRKYILKLDGQRVAVSTYRDAGNRRVFLHTEVDPDYAGQGLAGQLVRAELDDVRAKGMRIVASCPMVAGYVERHHDWDDILDHPAGVEG